MSAWQKVATVSVLIILAVIGWGAGLSSVEKFSTSGDLLDVAIGWLFLIIAIPATALLLGIAAEAIDRRFPR